MAATSATAVDIKVSDEATGQAAEQPKQSEVFDWWRISAMERGTAQPEEPVVNSTDDAAPSPLDPAECPAGFISLAAITGVSAETTFQCCICLEEHAIEQRALLKQCEQPTHSACGLCLTKYLRLRIEEGRVDELRCPMYGDNECKAYATEADVHSWLSPEICEKFNMFSQMRADPKLRACPQCNWLCRPKVQDGVDVMEMVCEACGCEFCYKHSCAHSPGKEACAEYVRNVEAKEQAFLRNMANTKACPRCSALTEKSSGCNHMTCAGCKANWCWVCGKELDHVGWHYNPANPVGCMQFQEELRNRRARHLMVLCKLVSMPTVLVSFILNIIFFICLILTSPVPICFCCREIGFKVWVAVAASIIGIPFVVFAFCWALVGFVIWLILCPCGAGEVHLQFLIGVPFLTTLALCEGVVGPDRAACVLARSGEALDDEHAKLEVLEVKRPDSSAEDPALAIEVNDFLEAEKSEVPLDVPTLAELHWLANLRTEAKADEKAKVDESNAKQGTTTSL